MKDLKLYMSSTHMLRREDWLACVTAAADAGFDGLELFGTRYMHDADMTHDQLDEIARAAKARGLILSGHPWVEWADVSLPELCAKLDKLCDDCARLGEREVVLHMDFLSHRQSGGMERLFAAVDSIYDKLARLGITLLLENVPAHDNRELGSEVGDFAALFARYTDVQGPVQMNIDSGHAYIMRNAAPLSKQFGTRWRYTHIDDNDGVEDLHIAPGEGSLDFKNFAACAAKAEYHGPLMMEYAMSKVAFGMHALRDAYGAQGYTLHELKLSE